MSPRWGFYSLLGRILLGVWVDSSFIGGLDEMGGSVGVDDLGSRWSAVRNGTNSASIVLINILNLL